MLSDDLHTLSDQQLLVLIAAGNKSGEDAYTALFHRYHQRVYTIAYRYLHTDESAQEVVQEFFARVWKYREKMGEVNDFYAWTVTVSRNLCLSEIRRRVNEQKAKGGMADGLSAVAESEMDSSKMQQVLGRAMKELTPQQRKIFELVRMEGMKKQDVAAQMNLSEATVENHYKRASRVVKLFIIKFLDLCLFVAALRNYF